MVDQWNHYCYWSWEAEDLFDNGSLWNFLTSFLKSSMLLFIEHRSNSNLPKERWLALSANWVLLKWHFLQYSSISNIQQLVKKNIIRLVIIDGIASDIKFTTAFTNKKTINFPFRQNKCWISFRQVMVFLTALFTFFLKLLGCCAPNSFFCQTAKFTRWDYITRRPKAIFIYDWK